MELIKNILIKLSGNSFAQNLLQKNIYISQYLSGIGAGSIAEQSGERFIFEILKKKYKAPYCIFDVGANRGQYLKLINQYLLRDETSIHCFEPHKESFEYLKVNNDNPNLQVNNLALSNEAGEKKLFYSDNDTRLACLTKRKLDHFNIELDNSQMVKVETIDSYCVKNNIERINLLKIDVEGYELFVLQGATKMFENKRIDIVTFEFGGTGIDTKIFVQDFYYFFKNYNKTLYRITPSGYLYKIEKYNEMLEQFRTTNFAVIDN
ncbi:MAG: FkbM family methyltransferase [Bacteroidetes bacterium]|nr:FkbM family methyltransferase [Bacteroidota bacterium]